MELPSGGSHNQTSAQYESGKTPLSRSVNSFDLAGRAVLSQTQTTDPPVQILPAAPIGTDYSGSPPSIRRTSTKIYHIGHDL